MRPRKLDPTVAPISTAVGVLGMLGMTAWSGVKIQCDPQLDRQLGRFDVSLRVQR